MKANFLTSVVALTVFCISNSSAFVQEEVDGVVQQRSIIVSADDSGGSTEVMAFEMSDSDGAMMLPHIMGDMDFSMGMSGNQFSMLNNASVQKDLQLVDDQVDQIKQINKDFGEKIKSKMDAMKDDDGNFNFQMGSDFGEMIRDLKQQQQDQISGILLPNQQKRLDQVARQIRMKRMGTSKALAGKLAEELGITPDQKQKIKERSKELQKEMQEKIAELRANAKNSLLQELTKDQRNKLEEMLGDEYVEKKEDSKRRFRFRRNETRQDF